VIDEFDLPAVTWHDNDKRLAFLEGVAGRWREQDRHRRE
jgi:hypothetical protein